VACRTHLRHDLHGQEHRHRLRRQLAALNLAPPVPQQTAAHFVPAGHIGKRRAGLLNLGHDAQLLFKTPATSPLNPSDDLHRTNRL